MFTYIAFSFLVMLSVAKSEVDLETACKNDYRNLTNNKIDVLKYCSDNLCIEKCCGEGEMFTPRGTCINTQEMFNKIKRVAKLASEVDYSKIILFSWDGTTKKESEKDFVFIKNHRDVKRCTSEHAITNDFFVVEDGSIRMQDTGGSKSWFEITKLDYCIDFKLTVISKKPVVKLHVRQYTFEDPMNEENILWIFNLVGMLVSLFSLILVLVVYCLLPKLQNLTGLVLMAYTASTLGIFLLKIIILVSVNSLTTKHCKILSPMLYFAAVSSFFWLNVMSFDVWWSLRLTDPQNVLIGHRKRCEMNRRSERVKFMWYCLYAWGAPLLMTAIVTTLDNIDLSNLNIIKPPFDDCFIGGLSVQLYYVTPIWVIIFFNIILFLLTVYNIWMIKRAVHRCPDSASSKQDTNRFATYIKLSVVTGVSWSFWLIILELIPPDTEVTLFILTTTYNLLIGVVIFFLFVFNKRIFVMLCKRFNIKNNFTSSLELPELRESPPPLSTKPM